MVMTKIAVVHKVTWTPEEWLRLEALGDVRYSPGLPSGEEELLAGIDGAQIVVENGHKLAQISTLRETKEPCQP